MILIFDWDGTLCDSTQKIVQCLRMASTDVGLPVLSDEQYKEIIGLGLPEAVQALYPDVSPEDSSELRSSYSRYFLEQDETSTPLYPGVEETLTRLKESGYTLTIATGKSRRGLNRVLEEKNLSGFFHGSRCADETASKPNPKMLYELLDEFQFNFDEAVMVGDTEFDMEMARRASMDRVAVSYGAHHITRLHPYDPVTCIDHFPHFLDYIFEHRSM